MFVRLIASKLDTSNVRVTGDGTYDIEPDNPDSDEDNALDGGGNFAVDGQQLGQRITDDDRFIKEGEVFDLPTDPTYPDVVEIVVAADEEFRNKHDVREGGYRGFIRDIIGTSEYHFNRQLDEPIHFAIVEWIEVTSDDQLGEDEANPLEQLRSIENSIEWNGTEQIRTPDDYADILSVFSHQKMGPDDDDFWTGFSDAVAPHDSRSLIIGTNDITYQLSEQHRELDATYHLYQHELGHVFSAVHPTDAPDQDDHTSGVMCKMSCFDPLHMIEIASMYEPGEENTDVAEELNNVDWMLGTHEWAEYNIQHIEKCREEVPLYDKNGTVCW